MTAPTSRLHLAQLNPEPAVVAPPPGPPPPGFAETLAHHVMGWHQSDQTEEHIWRSVTRTATALVPGAVGAAILVLSAPGKLTIRAAHGLVPELLTAASQGEPPRLQRPAGSTSTGRLQDLQSSIWPVFTAPGNRYGVDDVICTPLGSGTTMFGTLAVAAAPYDKFGQPTAGKVTALAMHASTALAAARTRMDNDANLLVRDTIGQSKGILMERHHLTAAEAFAELVGLSQASNTKLRDIATQIALTGQVPNR